MAKNHKNNKSSNLDVSFVYVGKIRCDNPATAEIMSHLPANLFYWNNFKDSKITEPISASRLNEHVHIYPERISYNPVLGRLELVVEQGLDILAITNDTTTFKYHCHTYIIYHKKRIEDPLLLKPIKESSFPDYFPAEGF